jgi:phytoene dehydrogenase-like protein
VTEPSIIIVGAGIGGLSAGCYARMNGYQVRILEMHGVAGGVCASWMRGGYVFDGCIHNLAGTSERSPLHSIWRELGATPARLFHAYDELVRVERPDGEPFVLYADLDRLQRHMHRLFPGDRRAIDQLIAAARTLVPYDVLGLAAASPRERLRTLGALPTLAKYGPLTLERYARRFSDPFLRRAFPSLVYDWPGQSMIMLLSFMAGAHKGDFGWPIGGSAAFARSILSRFRELGGEISFDARVQHILVEQDRAVGVRLEDGTQLRADIVVSNAYGPATLFEMLDGRYVSSAIRRRWSRPQDRVEFGLHVSLGVNRDLSDAPHAMVLPLDPPATFAGERHERLYVQCFGFDPSMAPHRKSVIKALYGTSYGRWEELHRTPEAYRLEKAAVLEATIDLLEQRFPGLKAQVEMSDVATPLTTRRYTGAGQGFPFSITDMALGLLTGRKPVRTVPGLAGFYMVGQWAGLPGVPLVAAQGRDLVRAICRRDHRPFVTCEPDGVEAAAARRDPFDWRPAAQSRQAV